MRDGSTAALEGFLPGLFADLEPWLDQWALATEQQRFDKRVSLTMDELRPFYEAMLDRMPTIMDHLAKLPIDGLSSEDDNLLRRSEEHTSELQSLMRKSYAVFSLKKKNKPTHNNIS